MPVNDKSLRAKSFCRTAFYFLLATISPKHYTLTTGLANIVNGALSAGNQSPLKLPASAVTIIPLGILFLVLQRYVVASHLSSAVKKGNARAHIEGVLAAATPG
jgi:ABC-type maltose transport system permease subunit